MHHNVVCKWWRDVSNPTNEIEILKILVTWMASWCTIWLKICLYCKCNLFKNQGQFLTSNQIANRFSVHRFCSVFNSSIRNIYITLGIYILCHEELYRHIWRYWWTQNVVLYEIWTHNTWRCRKRELNHKVNRAGNVNVINECKRQISSSDTHFDF